MKLTKPTFFYNKSFTSYCLLPLSIIYIIAITFRKTCLKFLYHRRQNTNYKTICIGNIVVGGSGKTPTVFAIGEYLTKKEKSVCVISKGYRRNQDSKLNTIAIPKSYHQVFDWRITGDEPLLLASSFDTYVVNSRIKNNINMSAYDYIIFDDGLQDYRVNYDIKIAVFDCNFFVGNGFTLPAGPLRESIQTSLPEINYIVLTDYNDSHADKIIELSKYIPKDKILTARLSLQDLQKHDINTQYIAFSGIGENTKFFNTLLKNNFKLFQTFSFSDHVHYADNDIDNIIDLATKNNCKIITTEKDYIKLSNKYQNYIEFLKISYKIDNIEGVSL